MKKILLISALTLISISGFAQSSFRSAKLVDVKSIRLKPAFKEIDYNLGSYIYSPVAMEMNFKPRQLALLGICAPQIESLEQISDKDVFRDEPLSLAYFYNGSNISLVPIKNIYAQSSSKGYSFVTYEDQVNQPNYGDEILRGYIIGSNELERNFSTNASGFIEIDNNGNHSRVTHHKVGASGSLVRRWLFGGQFMRQVQSKWSKQMTYSCHMMHGIQDKFNEVIGL